MLLKFYNTLHSFLSLIFNNRSLVALGVAWLFIFGLDLLCHTILFRPESPLLNFFRAPGAAVGSAVTVDMGYAPEVWLALLAMVLGTLIIVISIASQSIPKIIDLYMQDWRSLLYVWFLIGAVIHAIITLMYSESQNRYSSQILNIHFFLPLSVLIAFPYIFYILKYTKPNNVIRQILRNNLAYIHSLMHRRFHILFNNPSIVQEVQYALFESLNQLDDLLAYVSFKEPKAEIIANMSLSIQEYVRLKASINPYFFKVAPATRGDISFKTMVGQFDQMEESRTFYEQKCFRLLGNVYIKLLETNEFDLASLCVAEMSVIGLCAIEMSDDQLIDVIIIRFNTLLRFAIKHGLKHNEGRNLYNAAFHYGNFIEHLARRGKVEHLQRGFFYLRIYGTEIFKHSRVVAPALAFIVDVFAYEMKKILMLAHENNWDLDTQTKLLNEMLQVDSPPDVNKEDLERGRLINNGVRVLQMGLALYYMREGMSSFVTRIIQDILDDLEVLGEATFLQVIDATCNRLKFSGPTFWEDTDRGNLNIYYTSDQEQIDGFKELIAKHLQTHLLNRLSETHQLTPKEAQLLLELSKLQEAPQHLSSLAKEAAVFENTVLRIKNFNQQRLSILCTLREKLLFNSDNPQLTLTTSRQIAVNSKLYLQYQDVFGGLKQLSGRIGFSYLNFFYVELDAHGESVHWPASETAVTCWFQDMEHHVYSFQSHFEGEPIRQKLFKIVHVDQLTLLKPSMVPSFLKSTDA